MANFSNFEVSGGSYVLGSTFAEPYLFDASTFYNYEQDNIPLERIYERTDLLHQFVGFPGSEETRATTLTLSSTVDADNGVFDNIQDIVQRIPQRLTFPLLIELCDYGDLGNLDLRDITTVGNGQLQIVNRIYGYEPSATVDAVSSITTDATTQITNNAGQNGGYLVTSITSTDTDGVVNTLLTTSSTRVGTTLFDNTLLSGRGGRGVPNSTVFVTKDINTDSDIDKMFFSKGASRASNVLTITPYQNSIDSSIIAGDLAPREENGVGGRLEGFSVNAIPRKQIAAGSNAASVTLYGNYFREVSVTNCHGKIKLGSICVDGASGVDSTSEKLRHNTVHGFDIRSSDIYLESCASVRNRLSGFNVANSTVNVLGNFIGYRNYVKNDSDSTRSTTEFGAGLRATNSNVVFADESLVGWGSNSTFNKFQVSFPKNDYGIYLRSSELVGGTRLLTGTAIVPNGGQADQSTSVLAAYQNTRVGILAEQSEVSYLGRLDSFNNMTGVQLKNSTWNAPQLTADDNQAIGIDLEGSDLNYGYRQNEMAGSVLCDSVTGLKKRAYNATNNGINIKAYRNSSIKPYETYDQTTMYWTYIGSWGGRNVDIDFAGAAGVGDEMVMVSHGSTIQNLSIHDVPSVLISNSSEADFHNLGVVRDAAKARGKGIAVLATNDSKVSLRGSRTSPFIAGYNLADNSVFGTSEGLNSWGSAGVAATKSSNVQFTGPVKICRFGVAALAEDNSTVEFTTPKTDSGWSPETPRFALSATTDQSKMQIHATRSCVVANRNSSLVMKDMGGSANSVLGASTVEINRNAGFGVDHMAPAGYGTSAQWHVATSAAFIQFFPNGFGKAMLSSTQSAAYDPATPVNRFGRTAAFAPSGSISTGARVGPMDTLTTGGMVVRAIGGSNVECQNVNFCFNASPSATSGSVYNWNGKPGYEWDGNEPGGSSIGPGPGSGGDQIDPSSGGIRSSPAWPPWYGSGVGDPSAFQGQYNSEDNCGFPAPGTSAYDTIFYGTRIHIWNIADTSRIHCANAKIVNQDPLSFNNTYNFHGPPGKWRNGAALDYYGRYGLGSTYAKASLNTYANLGVFRLMLGHRGDLKSFYGVSALNYKAQNQTFGFGFNSPNGTGMVGLPSDGARGASGLFIDQLNAQGYQVWTPNAGYMLEQGLTNRFTIGAEPGIQGAYTVSGFENVFGLGLPASGQNVVSIIQPGMAAVPARNLNYWDEGDSYPLDTSGTPLYKMVQATPMMPIPPLHMDWQGYMRNWLDDSGANLFANSKHLATKKVNGCSIYRSHTGLGGEGRDDPKHSATFGIGVRSLNVFDLDSLL